MILIEKQKYSMSGRVLNIKILYLNYQHNTTYFLIKNYTYYVEISFMHY